MSFDGRPDEFILLASRVTNFAHTRSKIERPVVGRGYFSHANSRSENVASARRLCWAKQRKHDHGQRPTTARVAYLVFFFFITCIKDIEIL